MRQVVRVGKIGEIGDTASDNKVKAMALLGIPLVTSVTASYIINKKAYSKDFTLLKWIAIPLAVGVISWASYFLTRMAVGPFEENPFTGEEYYG